MSKKFNVVTGRNTASSGKNLQTDYIAVDFVYFGKRFSKTSLYFSEFSVCNIISFYCNYTTNDGFNFTVYFVHHSPSLSIAATSSRILPFADS